MSAVCALPAMQVQEIPQFCLVPKCLLKSWMLLETLSVQSLAGQAAFNFFHLWCGMLAFSLPDFSSHSTTKAESTNCLNFHATFHSVKVIKSILSLETSSWACWSAFLRRITTSFPRPGKPKLEVHIFKVQYFATTRILMPFSQTLTIWNSSTSTLRHSRFYSRIIFSNQFSHIHNGGHLYSQRR